MRVLTELISYGYRVELRGENLKLFYERDGVPDKEKVIPLINELKAKKSAAVGIFKRIDETLSRSFKPLST